MNRFFKSAVAIIIALLGLNSCTSDYSDLNPVADKNEDNSTLSEANSISIDEALENADQFLSQAGFSNTRGSKSVKSVEFILNKTTRSDNNEDRMNFYLVNFEQGGFAILPADTRAAASVYAFSEDGSLNLSDTVGNAGLQNYLAAISYSNGYVPGDLTPNPIVFPDGKLYKTRPPLATRPIAEWHQRAPFNKYCYTKDGRQAVVGCVPLAVGQVMAIMRWPNQWPINGDKSGEHYVFDWDAVEKGWVDNTSHLLEILGRKGHLETSYDVYGTSGSSSPMNRCDSTFIKFGYNHITEGNFNIRIAERQLRAGKPVILCGKVYQRDSRHAWITDGFYTFKPDPIVGTSTITNKTYFHLIWGSWGGGNGFYLFDESIRGFGGDEAIIYDYNDNESQHNHNHYYLCEMYYDFTKQQ